MGRIAVAGIVNVRVALPVTGFPVPFASSRRLPGQIALRLSGVGWTVANTLKALGGEVVFATYVGRDAGGVLASAGLREAGLFGPTTQVCASTPCAVVLYDAAGTRAGHTDLGDTTSLAYPVEVFTAALDSGARCGLALLSNIGFTRSLIAPAVDRGIPVVTDLHVISDLRSAHNAAWMRAAHVLSCSHEKLPCPPGEWIRRVWRRYRTPVVIVGCGSGGALVGTAHDRRIWHVPAVAPRGVRYTSGAGDTLLSTFAHHYLELGDPVTALAYGVLAAGWKVGAGPEEAIGSTGARLRSLVEEQGLPRPVPAG